ncbi:hypothetical protein LCGC14_0748090 [marine sediment metagenome]|uniref:Uncharacterized protein n=1 Tax=marine sediment metagenome TaxID=412755 RepID=A0A0F9Q4S1_9ZZZZ
MHLLRKQDLSVYYFLEDMFSAYDFVNIVDGYPDEELVLPTISVEAMDVDSIPHELGNRVGLKDRFWDIEVFALNKAQRDEFAYLIMDNLEVGVSINDYDEGFPPDVIPTKIGALDISNLTLTVVTLFPTIQEKLYWRMSITFTSIFNQL